MENPNTSHVLNYQLQDAYGVGSSIKDHHVVSIQLGDHVACAKDGGAAGCCVVCMETLEWVTVGRCGHRAVCSKCMIRIRHVDGDKLCCLCRTHCPTVMVTRADGTAGAAVSSFREYWYHRKTAAYFDDEQQYQAAREACRKKLSPYYHPLHMFILLFASAIILGAVMGDSFTNKTKHRGLKVLGFTLSISVSLSLVSFMWFMFKCDRDPPADDEEDEVQVARAGIPLEQQLHLAHLAMKNHGNRTRI